MPKVVDHKQRKQLIIDKSTDIIAEHGFDELTIRGLAASLNMSTGMITHYFDSKDQILFAALQGVHDRFYHRAEKAIGYQHGIEAIRRRMQASIPLAKSVKKDWSIMFQFWGRATHEAEFSKYMKREHSKLRQLDLDHLAYAQAHGEIDKKHNLEHIFEQLDAMTTGMGITSVFNPSRLNKNSTHAIIDETLQQLKKR